MSVDMKIDWTELAESLAEGQKAMEKAGFDMGGGRTVEGHVMELPPSPFLNRDGRSIDDWLKMQNLNHTVQWHDDLIRQLQERQDRQGKWIAFLLLAWVFSVVFMWFGVLMTV